MGNHHDHDCNSTGTGNMVLGFLAGAAAAGAASYYFLLRGGGIEKIKQHKLDRRRFELIKDRVLHHMHDVKDISKEAYDRLVDDALEEYAHARHLTREHSEWLADRLKSQYQQLRREVEEAKHQDALDAKLAELDPDE